VPAAVNLREARYPREWAERSYSDLRRFTTLPRAGWREGWYECAAGECATWTARWSGGAAPVVKMLVS